MRRRIRRTVRFLNRHRRFFLVCLILAGLFFGFRFSISAVSCRMNRATRELEELEKKHPLAVDPQRAIAERRRLEFERSELAFYVLLLAIPGVFVSIAIILILHSSTKGFGAEPTRTNPQRSAQDNAFREKVRAHFEAKGVK